MKKKVLFSATVDSHIKQFNTPLLKYFKEKGYEVHVATSGTDTIPYCDVKHLIPFERSPFKINNIRAISRLKKIIDKEHFEIIHTHTPMGSAVTRLAASGARKQIQTKVVYTAHGFHFFKGAPVHYWALFYPTEKILARYTDALITINAEDYEIANKKFRTKVFFVPGELVDESKFDFKMTNQEKLKTRESLGLSKNSIIAIYPAELSKRKRQEWLISSLSSVIQQNPKLHILLPGRDNLNGVCQKLVETLDLTSNVHFLGYRDDMPQLLKIADIAVSTSSQEGLPVNIIEAMINGLPIVATDSRGNRDLLKDSVTGFLIPKDNMFLFAERIMQVMAGHKNIGIRARERSKDYSLGLILPKITEVYEEAQFE